jgi:hypothetical protein
MDPMMTGEDAKKGLIGVPLKMGINVGRNALGRGAVSVYVDAVHHPSKESVRILKRFV